MSSFVHLRVHSAYSLAEGALPVKKLPELCLKHGYAAAAVTDTDAMFGAAEFSEVMHKSGLRPIIGVQQRLILPASGPHAPVRTAPLVLLAADETGYDHLCRLSAEAAIDRGLSHPAITEEALYRYAAGIICLTGGGTGPLAPEGDRDAARDLARRLQAAFGDRLYIELQRLGLANEAETEDFLVNLAYDLELPLVATNDVLFDAPDFFPAHEVLTCIAEGSVLQSETRTRRSPEQWFKPPSLMRERFADLPEAADNTLEIAVRCAFRPTSRAPMLPGFAEDEAALLRAQAHAGLQRRLSEQPHFDTPDNYVARLDFELNVIGNMGFAGYFLIVADFIQFAKTEGIPVGPGRGSGAGSVVAWSLQITDLDPLRFGLLFERFLNPERVSMPDFDIDFCQERRDEVITYVREKYGAGRVAQIITFGKLQARAVLRDVGRVLQMPYGQVDRICKLIPNNPADPYTIARALEEEPQLQEARESEEGVAELLTVGDRLEGLYRHASTHAAGVVITDRPLSELMPVYRDPRSDMPVTQFNMKWAEWAGAVKFDFLGLKTLTVLQKTVQLLERDGIRVEVDRLPFDDAATYAMLGRGDTAAVFQLESTGMRDVLRRMKPDCLEDIIALVALYRPGPMDNIPRYIACKRGEETPDYLHPELEPVLRETYGVMIYQEQVMQIAQILSGYSLGEADLLRRAMGKKIKAEMDQQKARFVEGAVRRGIEALRAESVFELVAKFAGYGFNKSHAAAYAVVSYQTAYMKANHPAHFTAAVMTLDAAHTDKLLGHTQDAERMGLHIDPPDVCTSDAEFTVHNGRIRYALGAVRGFGSGAAAMIAAERLRNGPYTDVFDLMRRHDNKVLNKRTLETLIAAGALDTFGIARRRLFDAISLLSAAVGDRGDGGLFGALPPVCPELPVLSEWSPQERLTREFGALGLYLSAHPLDDKTAALQRSGALPYADAAARVRESGTVLKAVIAGSVMAVKERKSSKTGNRFLTLNMSDRSGMYEAVLFSEVAEKTRDKAKVGAVLLFICDVEPEGEGGEGVRLRIREAIDFQSLPAGFDPAAAGRTLIVEVRPSESVFTALRGVLEAAPQRPAPRSNLVLCWPEDGRRVRMLPYPKAMFLQPEALADRLRGIVGVSAVG